MDLTTNYGLDEFNDYLAHYGIPDMKWGVRRYQNKDGSLTAAGKKRYGATRKEGIKRSIQKRLDALEAKRKEQSEKHGEKKEENLKEYLRRKPQKLYKYRDELTKEEVDDLMKQIEWDRKVADISLGQHKRNMERVNQIAKDVKSLGDLLNNSVSTYNNIAMVYNGFIDVRGKNDVKPMRYVSSDKNPNNQKFKGDDDNTNSNNSTQTQTQTQSSDNQQSTKKQGGKKNSGK